MNLYDIVTPLTIEETKGWALDPKTRLELKKRREQNKIIAKYAGKTKDEIEKKVKEDAWHDGSNDWTSEHDQWTKESADPVIALTGVDEAIGYESNKAYAEVGPYKRYTVYVTKKKFNEKFGFIAVAVNPRTNDAKFKAAGKTQQEAVSKLQAEVDKEIDVATKVSGAATIDFNVDFVRDVLEMSSNTFYAKIIPGPKLVIAGKEMEQYPDIMKQEGFKASSIRTVGDSEGATKLPAMPLSASGATTAQLVANGRYALGAETIDKDGNRIFDLEFDSVVADPRERIRMGSPAITIGTKRETKESSNDFMANDSTSPIGGNMQFENRLRVGDPIIVTAPNAYEGKTGEIDEFSPSGKFVVVNLYNHGRHSMHLSDIEYNQYADEVDEHIAKVKGGYELKSKHGNKNLGKYPTRAGAEKRERQVQYFKHAGESVEEGFQDFNKVEPYEVCLAGKPVKQFDYYEDARRFHDNWKKKLYNQGEKAKADKITLNPIMKEGIVDAIRKKNYDRLANRSFNKARAAQDKASEYDFDNVSAREPHEKEFRNQMAKMRQREKKADELDEFAPGGGYQEPPPPVAKKKDPFDDDDRSIYPRKIQQLLASGAKVDSRVPGAMGHVFNADDRAIRMKRLNKPYSQKKYAWYIGQDRDEKLVLKQVAPNHYVLFDRDWMPQGVAEGDDFGDLDAVVFGGIDKEKKRLADLKKRDPEAYAREMAKEKSRNRIPPVSTFEEQGVMEDEDQWDSGEDVTVTHGDQSTKYQYKGCKFVINGEQAQGEAWWYEPGDTWRDAEHFTYRYDEPRGINRFYNESGQNVFNLSASDQSQWERFVKAKAQDFVSTMVSQPKPTTVHEAGVAEVKQRLDAKCWKGKHKEGTKIKGGVRVNNCVPNESVEEAQTDYEKRRAYEKQAELTNKPKKTRQPSNDYFARRAKEKRDLERFGESTDYWTKLQNERNTKLNSLVNELKESIKK